MVKDTWSHVKVQLPGTSRVFVVVLERHNDVTKIDDSTLGDIAFDGAQLDPGSCKSRNSISFLCYILCKKITDYISQQCSLKVVKLKKG